ncbi:hypothetical protein Kpho02_67140 [Kitasatospora phosalacinea]|uniref:Uncharacterized protein n=1 Tax=Kitasatospora phosalacinea TaxID=2065 RepID=A0A9W6V467_9ACTN|nr:hypothetical protein Kpho02_67140 [Kitasatospora phosalacinea]
MVDRAGAADQGVSGPPGPPGRAAVNTVTVGDQLVFGARFGNNCTFTDILRIDLDFTGNLPPEA